MTETPVIHKLTYAQVGVAWTKVACSCGQQSDSQPNTKRGSKEHTRWILKHQVATGVEPDLSEIV